MRSSALGADDPRYCVPVPCCCVDVRSRRQLELSAEFKQRAIEQIIAPYADERPAIAVALRTSRSDANGLGTNGFELAPKRPLYPVAHLALATPGTWAPQHTTRVREGLDRGSGTTGPTLGRRRVSAGGSRAANRVSLQKALIPRVARRTCVA